MIQRGRPRSQVFISCILSISVSYDMDTITKKHWVPSLETILQVCVSNATWTPPVQSDEGTIPGRREEQETLHNFCSARVHATFPLNCSLMRGRGQQRGPRSVYGTKISFGGVSPQGRFLPRRQRLPAPAVSYTCSRWALFTRYRKRSVITASKLRSNYAIKHPCSPLDWHFDCGLYTEKYYLLLHSPIWFL